MGRREGIEQLKAVLGGILWAERDLGRIGF
jgi:hypothetical protein